MIVITGIVSAVVVKLADICCCDQRHYHHRRRNCWGAMAQKLFLNWSRKFMNGRMKNSDGWFGLNILRQFILIGSGPWENEYFIVYTKWKNGKCVGVRVTRVTNRLAE